jgi:hypothetical protein
VGKLKRTGIVPIEDITRSILILRGQRVILDSDLAAIYGVTTGRLNEAIKRNLDRFPQDFMLRLSAAENAALISQIATSKTGRGGRRKLPWAFTSEAHISNSTGDGCDSDTGATNFVNSRQMKASEFSVCPSTAPALAGTVTDTVSCAEAFVEPSSMSVIPTMNAAAGLIMVIPFMTNFAAGSTRIGPKTTLRDWRCCSCSLNSYRRLPPPITRADDPTQDRTRGSGR